MNNLRDIARLVSRGKRHDQALGAYLKWLVNDALRKNKFKTAREMARAAGRSWRAASVLGCSVFA